MRRGFILSVGLVAPSLAATYPITNDTYLNSFVTSTTVNGVTTTVDFRRTNYGNSGAVKAISNDGSGSQYPDVTSLVHGLFTLPSGAITELGATGTTAVVTYRFRNPSLGGRTVELHPLTRPFTEGTGSTPSDTQLGTDNTPTNPLGADWLTSDATLPWTTPGGDFAAAFVSGVTRVVGSTSFLDFDLAPLLADPTSRLLLQTNGLLMRLNNETSYTGNLFASLFSGETANVPIVSVPEPAAIGLFGVSAIALIRRRRSV